MVKIYTNIKYIPDNITDVITDNTRFFRTEVNIKGILEKEISNDCLYCMEKIDGVKELDYKTGSIITPFGATSIGNLSTGCHTALNILSISNRKKPLGVDITLCGANALNVIFELFQDKFEVSMILRHWDLTGCNNGEFLINNTERAGSFIKLAALLAKFIEKDGD
jgi:hypothetical protein